MSRLRGHYEVLETSRTADQAAIHKAYRSLSKRDHPDKNPGARDRAEARMKEINRAYKVLSDVARRMEYDKAVDAERMREASARGQHMNASATHVRAATPPQPPVRISTTVSIPASGQRSPRIWMVLGAIDVVVLACAPGYATLPVLLWQIGVFLAIYLSYKQSAVLGRIVALAGVVLTLAATGTFLLALLQTVTVIAALRAGASTGGSRNVGATRSTPKGAGAQPTGYVGSIVWMAVLCFGFVVAINALNRSRTVSLPGSDQVAEQPYLDRPALHAKPPTTHMVPTSAAALGWALPEDAAEPVTPKREQRSTARKGRAMTYDEMYAQEAARTEVRLRREEVEFEAELQSARREAGR